MMRKLKLKSMVFLAICSWLFYLIVIRYFAGNVLLKNYGICSKTVLIDKPIRPASSQRALLYGFFYNGKTYEGNSLEKDLSKVGDAGCIVYLKSFPGINQPITFFDSSDIKCKCYYRFYPIQFRILWVCGKD